MVDNEHFVIKSGDMYLTCLEGYSRDINKAMLADPTLKLVGNQRFVKVKCTYIVEEIDNDY